MSSTEQRDAVRQIHPNKSTGPTSEKGKAIASQNARRHGVFSAQLILEDEDANDFAALQLDLQQSLAPVGTIEVALVEKIAITMWRQRRLVSAETAKLTLLRTLRAVAKEASSYGSYGFGKEVSEEGLQPFDGDRLKWCEQTTAEIQALGEVTLKSLQARAPLVWQQLQDDAQEDDQTPEECLNAHENGATGYISELYAWCISEIEKSKTRPKLLAHAAQLRQKNLILPLDQLALFARYQTTLDNQLFKILKALREAQEWRLKTIDAPSTVDPTMQDKAA